MDDDHFKVLEMARWAWERDSHDEDFEDAFLRVVNHYGLKTDDPQTFDAQMR